MSFVENFRRLSRDDPQLLRPFISFSGFEQHAALLVGLANGNEQFESETQREQVITDLQRPPLNLWFVALDECVDSDSIRDNDNVLYKFLKIQGAGSDGVAVRVLSVAVDARSGALTQRRAILKVAPMEVDNFQESLFLERLRDTSPNLLRFDNSFQCDMLPNPPSQSLWSDVQKRFEREEIKLNERDFREAVERFADKEIRRWIYVGTEFASGGSFNGYLQDNLETLSLQTLYSFALQMLAGLRELHLQGIAHRDMHTDNLLVDRWPDTRELPFYLVPGLLDERVQLHSVQPSGDNELNLLIADFGRSADRVDSVAQSISQIEIRAPENLFPVLDPSTNTLLSTVDQRADLWAAAVNISEIFSRETVTLTRTLGEYKVLFAFRRRLVGIRSREEFGRLTPIQRYLQWLRERAINPARRSVESLEKSSGQSIVTVIALITFVDEFQREFGEYSASAGTKKQVARGVSNRTDFADGASEETAMTIWRLITILGTDGLLRWLRRQTGISSERLLKQRVPVYDFVMTRALDQIRRSLRVLQRKGMISAQDADFEYESENVLEQHPERFLSFFTDRLQSDAQRLALLRVISSALQWDPQRRDSAAELLGQLYAEAESLPDFSFVKQRVGPVTRARKREQQREGVIKGKRAKLRALLAQRFRAQKNNKNGKKKYRCAACNEQHHSGSMRACSGCRTVYYCSEQCADRHWTEQKHYQKCNVVENQ